MSTKHDYYDILGIDKQASLDDIKRVYRKLAMEFHPDRNKSPDAEEKFKDISESYAVLSDQNKRQQYDQFGHAGIDMRYSQEDIFRGAPDIQDILRDLGMGMFNKGADTIFNIVFGQQNQQNKQNKQNQQNQPRRGQDILHRLSIDLEDAVIGKTVNIEVPRTYTCDVCNGNGTKPGTTSKQCQSCQGKGNISTTQNTPFGLFTTTSTCGLCRGSGKIIDTPCNTCHGSGRIQKKRNIEVKIPIGIDTGHRLRILAEGENGQNGGPVGDLYVDIYISPNPLFIRKDNNIITDVSISFIQAILGDKISIPLLDGSKTEIEIPRGTQNGQMFTIKDKGMPIINTSDKGDLFAKINITIPTQINDRQKEILLEFDNINKK